MTDHFLRYRDLVARGIVANRPALKILIDKNGFPPGVLAGANTRIFSEAAVEKWLASRPTERKPAPRRRNSPSKSITPVP